MAELTYREFAWRLLRREGWPISPNTVEALVVVFTVEGSHAKYDPEDTELVLPGSTDYNAAGVQNYPSLAEGLEAFADTLTNGYYPSICAAFAAGAPAETILGCGEWDTWTGTAITGLYAQVLAEVRLDPGAYYLRRVTGSLRHGPDTTMPVYRAGDLGPGILALKGALHALGWGDHVSDFEVSPHWDAPMSQVVENFKLLHKIDKATEPHWGPQCWAALFPRASSTSS